ncbi:unnamed protein product [Lepeophtheirus salmonis]|uniref:(salmon louse) hypothetical protein n=1 Tax=Lepeophtheirus salmonis TaxID=72036 RepID=A0A7R8CIY1_LEPSM|nr:unnamed protein product [Lepeophtheirus salmonis]CAF2837478.1 unnamed protein product [Lepeophtheirus salmonis]
MVREDRKCAARETNKRKTLIEEQRSNNLWLEEQTTDVLVSARRDFTQLKEIGSHKNHIIKEVGRKAMNRHLLYLSEVAVALYSWMTVSGRATKLMMVSNMNTVERLS